MVVRLLVTGVEGQVARSFVERAASHGDFAISCIGRPELDLSKPETIERAVLSTTPDIVIGAAAYTAVDRAEEEPSVAMCVNGEAAGLLARASRVCGARMIHVSTDYVYDGRKSSPYVEGDPANPQNAYGRSKHEGEERVLAELPEAMIIRTSWVYSPFGRNFVKTMLEFARTRDLLRIVDDQNGNPTSALDLADAILSIVAAWRDKPDAGLSEIYHCAGTGETTWCGFAKYVLEVSRAQGGPFAEVAGIATRDWPTKAVRPANSRLDCHKLARDFSWRAPNWHASADVVVRRLLAAPKI
jgi:dTDP-4-dehydrorhamnose reductase